MHVSRGAAVYPVVCGSEVYPGWCRVLYTQVVYTRHGTPVWYTCHDTPVWYTRPCYPVWYTRPCYPVCIPGYASWCIPGYASRVTFLLNG